MLYFNATLARFKLSTLNQEEEEDNDFNATLARFKLLLTDVLLVLP